MQTKKDRTEHNKLNIHTNKILRQILKEFKKQKEFYLDLEVDYKYTDGAIDAIDVLIGIAKRKIRHSK